MVWLSRVITGGIFSLSMAVVIDAFAESDVNLNHVTLLENEITALENDLGPFHTHVGQKLVTLGVRYFEQGDAEQARNAFERSLQILKRQHGLYSEHHIPIIQRLIDTLQKLESWHAVDTYHDYLYWVSRRFYGDTSPQLLPVLNAFVLWKVEAVNARVISNQKGLLTKALKAVRNANDIIAKHPHLTGDDALVISEQELKQALSIIQDREQSLSAR